MEIKRNTLTLGKEKMKTGEPVSVNQKPVSMKNKVPTVIQIANGKTEQVLLKKQVPHKKLKPQQRQQLEKEFSKDNRLKLEQKALEMAMGKVLKLSLVTLNKHFPDLKSAMAVLTNLPFRMDKKVLITLNKENKSFLKVFENHDRIKVKLEKYVRSSDVLNTDIVLKLDLN